MLRAIWLTIGKEFRLILRDRVGLFMLLAAPIAVIAAAGFSLAKLYGGESHGVYVVAVVDEDHGAVARAIVEALGKEPDLKIVDLPNRAEAQDIVRRQRVAVVAIVIAPSTTRAIENGESARLILYSDPVKYLQTVKIELKISELCRALGAAAAKRVRKQSGDFLRQVQNNLAEAQIAADRANADAARLAAESKSKRAAIATEIQAQVRRAIADAHDHAESALDAELSRAQRKLEADTAAQQSRLDQLKDYLRRLAAAHDQFEQWFGQLKDMAGNRAAKIPQPPSFPAPPPGPDFAKIEIGPAADLKEFRRNLENALKPPTAPITIDLPQMTAPKIPKVEIPRIYDLASRLAIPGALGYVEVDRDGREIGAVGGFNAFDLQVPGFAVTFLLIGMLMGVSLALIDEHDWGTLERLRSASAPLWTTLTGKLLARFGVGLIQMIVLFAVGRALFGISLGRTPAALLMPAASIAFAGAAFGLIVAGIGRTRDAVLPVGAIVIMTMAAVGGCWWPIDFEPPWMQQIALALPTTWTMRAFNDLMIRDLPAASALVPSLINFGFGILYTIIGVAVARRRFS